MTALPDRLSLKVIFWQRYFIFSPELMQTYYAVIVASFTFLERVLCYFWLLQPSCPLWISWRLQAALTLAAPVRQPLLQVLPVQVLAHSKAAPEQVVALRLR